MKLDCNVVMARGFSAYLLRNLDSFVPVVEIPVTANDIIRCIVESKSRFGDKRIVVMGTKNIIYQAENLSEFIGMETEMLLMPSQMDDETEKAFVKIRNQDCVVIGGKTVCDYAAKIGFNNVMIESGRTAMWLAISEAKRAAYISRIEEEKAQRLKTILDSTIDGIVSIDRSNRITVLNAISEKILGLAADSAIGKKIEEVLPTTKFSELINSTDTCIDEVIKHNNLPLAVNKTAIELKNKRVGSVITFQYVSKIQESEGRIRVKTNEHGHSAKHYFYDIIGSSEKIKETIRIAKKISEVDSNALIVGKSGTGKEMFAQSIHNQSRRRKEPFVAINCAAIPDNLLESELFGYVEGAFTGAVKGGKQGLIELAHRGTLFLDEISEMALSLQGRLLRVIQEKEIMRLGHDKVIAVDVRIISATNKDLEALVEKGEFREDLFYRLDVLKIELPSLDERKEDIPLMIDSFINEHRKSSENGNLYITNDAKRRLQELTWKGNIRELKNACEKLFVLTEANVIDRDDVDRVLKYKIQKMNLTALVKSEDLATENAGIEIKKAGSSAIYEQVKSNQNQPHRIKEKVSEEINSDVLKSLLAQGIKKSQIAETFGINRTTLWRFMKKYGVK